ncbi:hypothetical protein LJK88_23190 [Paenibacillus sp. P26]|nr:hypothetical protein LJK88_23190 [Paenibacillus sp. P26]UUZ95571.1 hypothetical protein LJK87_14670 [Paenibacillus sp. P25]
MKVTNVRFIERDYYKNMMVANGDHEMTESQIEKILDASSQSWADLTFRFFDNGSVIIIDNHTELQVPLKELKGAASDFFIKQRIKMIRANLEAKISQSA